MRSLGRLKWLCWVTCALSLVGWAGTARAGEIHQAIRHGNLERVLELLRRDRGLIYQKEGSWTPLHVAVAANQPEVASLLLAFGPDMEVVDQQGRTPLLLAAEMTHRTQVMQVLLNGGANPLAVDFRDRSALDLAAHSQNKPSMRAFVDHVKSRDDIDLELQVPAGTASGADVDYMIKPPRSPRLVPYERRQPIDFEMHRGFTSMADMLVRPLY